ncbi:hypothetical protein ACN263_29125 [Micromonospora sp. WMMD729]|uniref:hypothetical protein n=1 Tax=Micromonospora sp. WMMD729 TaxID=3404127 RepID=UPI003BF53F9E
MTIDGDRRAVGTVTSLVIGFLAEPSLSILLRGPLGAQRSEHLMGSGYGSEG